MRISSGLLVLLSIIVVSSGSSTQLYAQDGDEGAGQRISFLRFLAVGLPVTLLSLVIASAYLLAFQL
jgi:Na+/H+ antiporter NhaD/arsenite permease-like protein